MKKHLFITFLLIFLQIGFYAQDTTYLDICNIEMPSVQTADYYRIVEHQNDSISIQRDYFLSGQIKTETKLNADGLTIGRKRVWFENGQLRKDMVFFNGVRDGLLMTFWESGQVRRKEIYNLGELMEWYCWDKFGNEVEYYSLEKMPEFPGGVDSLFQYLGRNIKYPPKERNMGIRGKVKLTFVVCRDGTIKDIRIIQPVSVEIDAEAVRVISKMPKWKPGMIEEEPVAVLYNLPINFIIK